MCKVALFAGAWIETILAASYPRSLYPSLPSRERGLKQVGAFKNRENAESLPSRERGLKLYRAMSVYEWNVVAPFAGAWIETLRLRLKTILAKSLPSRERGLKPVSISYKIFRILSLPSRERGLKLSGCAYKLIPL